MEEQKNYIRWIRSKVGHERVILVFAGGCIYNDKGEVLLQRRGTKENKMQQEHSRQAQKINT